MARTPRLLRAVLAALVLGTLVVGVPIALWRLGGGWPLPHRVPNWAHVWRAAQQGDVPGRVVVRILAAGLWLVWLQVAWATVWEIVVNLPGRQRAARPRPAPVVAAPIGHGIARLVSAVLVVGIVGAQSPAAALAARAPSGHAPWRGSTPTTSVRPSGPNGAAVFRSSPTSNTAAASKTAAASSTRSASSSAAVPMPEATWRVARNDSLWRVAEHALGDGNRFPEILALNPFLAGPRDVRAGQELRLPSDALVPPERRVAAATVEVAPGDSLWTIARNHLAADHDQTSPPTDPEIAEHVNAVVDVNDIPSGNPNLIHPGEHFRLPAVGTPAPVTPVTGVTPAATVSGPAVVDDVAATAVAPEPTTGGPGQTRPLGPPPGDVASSRLAPPIVRPASGDVLVRLVEATEPATSAPAMSTGLAGATLLATGAAGLLAARRRRRLRGMGPGHGLVPADPDLAPTELALRLAADPQAVTRLDLALRALAAAADPGGSRPQLVVRRGSNDLEFWFTAPLGAPPPLPWSVGQDPRCVVLPSTAPLPVLAAAARGVPAPCPTLVLLGRSAGDEVYLDLEAAGTIVVDGSPDDVGAVARGLVASLALSPLADVVDLVACGLDCYGFTRERRVHSVTDASEAITQGNRLVDGTRRALIASGLPGTFALRAGRREEPWEPVVVVVVRCELDRLQLLALDDLAAGGGAAVITDRPLAGATWHLRATAPGHWRLDPVGIELAASGLAADELADVGALLADADAEPPRGAGRADDQRARHRTVDGGGPALWSAPPSAAPSAPGSIPTDVGSGIQLERPWSLLVRVLGPVDVVNATGTTVDVERSKALELVVWLAHHRNHASRVNARTALWHTDVRDATFLNVVSDARRALARLVPPPAGEEWIGRSGGDRLPLHPLVVTDADLLAARMQCARTQPHADAVATLRAGLELVRGVPLGGVAYLWPDGEGLPSALTHLVTSAATVLGEHYLAATDLDGVLWATGRGLAALPGHEELVCLRMRAQHRAGNLAGVRAEFDSYERVITNDDWGDGEPAAQVLALRRELLGQRAGG